MEPKTIRLRASCNACNESKVRCSQLKPTCKRCERNGIECVYGLSRRTHKDAPPISMPSSRRSYDITPPFTNIGGTQYASSTPPPPSSRHSSTETTHDAVAAFFGDYMMRPQQHFIITTPQPQQQNQHLDFNTLMTGAASSCSSSPHIDSRTIVPTGFPTAVPEPSSNPYDIVLTPPFDSSSLHDDTPSRSGGDSNLRCTCHAGVTELLASMRGGGDDRRLSLDAQLTKLKRCIASSETSMRCIHTRGDAEPIHIMAVATLIGYMIDEFSTLASSSHESPVAASVGGNSPDNNHDIDMMGSSLSSPSSGSGGSTPTSNRASSSSLAALGGSNTFTTLEPGPRLSWGMLQLEDDDEADLRQRLTLLSFRRLEKLLAQLTLFLRSQHDAQSSLPDPSTRHMAFLMACDYTRLWLEKKAEDVKRLFSAIPAARE